MPLGDPSREAIHNVANTLQFARNGAVGFIVGHYSPSMILRIAIIARTPAAVGVIAKLIISDRARLSKLNEGSGNFFAAPTRSQ